MPKKYIVAIWISLGLSAVALLIAIGAALSSITSTITPRSGQAFAVSPNGAYADFSTEGFDAPNLTFFDDQGRRRMELGLTKAGTPFIFMLDENGTQVVAINSVSRSGAPTFFLRSPSHPFRSFEIIIDADGKATVKEHPGSTTLP